MKKIIVALLLLGLSIIATNPGLDHYGVVEKQKDDGVIDWHYVGDWADEDDRDDGVIDWHSVNKQL